MKKMIHILDVVLPKNMEEVPKYLENLLEATHTKHRGYFSKKQSTLRKIV